MCTPANAFIFSGQISVNGRSTQYNNELVPIPSGFKNCLTREGDKLSIKTTTPIGTYVNTLIDKNGKINGILRFPGAIIKLNGSGEFN